VFTLLRSALLTKLGDSFSSTKKKIEKKEKEKTMKKKKQSVLNFHMSKKIQCVSNELINRQNILFVVE